jgi:hypothetical protein
MSETEYSYLASLLQKARKDTQEDETAQDEPLIVALRFSFVRSAICSAKVRPVSSIRLCL